MAMAYIKLYYDQLEILEPFSEAEVGRLIRGLLAYAATGEQPKLTGNERFIWNAFKVAVDRDAEQYATKCDKLRENGRSGGKARKANASTQKQMQANASEEEQMQANAFSEKQMPPRQEKEKEKEYTPLTLQGETTGGTSYIADNLRGMTAGNWEELRSYLDDGLTIELVNHAVDEAAANGKRNWAYVRGILNRFLEQGITSVEQAKNTAAPKQPEAPRPKYRWVGDDDDC